METTRKKALIVDDESDVREFFRAVLEDDGFDVLVACDGEQALALALAEEGPLAIIISDIQMPKKDGLILLKDLKATPRLSSVPVILLTGLREKTGLSFTKDDISDTLGAEPAAYVEKPVSPHDLVKLVHSLVAGT